MAAALLQRMGVAHPERALRLSRRHLGLSITAAGALLLLNELTASLAVTAAIPTVASAFQGGLVAALATAAGAFPVLLARRLSPHAIDTLLGFGAGVMLAATAFSLILPALAAGIDLGYSRGSAAALVATGILAGAMALLGADRALPHEHMESGDRPRGAVARRIWLFVAAITLHNIPEGLAIGVAFGKADGGSTVAGGIAIQDIPEGLVVAAALAGAGFSRLTATLVAAATGLTEPLAALLGASLVVDLPAILPWALAFAAGAMLFVVSHEIIPESHRRGHQTQATSGLVIGFCLMMMLDTALG